MSLETSNYVEQNYADWHPSTTAEASESRPEFAELQFEEPSLESLRKGDMLLVTRPDGERVFGRVADITYSSSDNPSVVEHGNINRDLAHLKDEQGKLNMAAISLSSKHADNKDASGSVKRKLGSVTRTLEKYGDSKVQYHFLYLDEYKPETVDGKQHFVNQNKDKQQKNTAAGRTGIAFSELRESNVERVTNAEEKAALFDRGFGNPDGDVLPDDYLKRDSGSKKHIH
jgi:hypothetical protein